MNEIKAQDIRSSASVSASSSPQLPEQNADVQTEQAVKAVANAEKAATDLGKKVPEDVTGLEADAKNVEVEEVVSKLNEYVQKTERNLDFSLDEDSGKTVIRVYDRQSEQLVRQIPDEVALELAKKLNAEEPALLFSAQV